MTLLEVLLVVVAVALGSLAKGITSIGLAMISIPAVALVTGVEDAVVMVAAPNAAANYMLVWSHREVRSQTDRLALFVGLGCVGAAAGVWLLSSLAERWLLIFLSAMVAAFLVRRMLVVDPRFSPSVRRFGFAPAAIASGVSQGTVGVSGPIVATWFHGVNSDRRVFSFSNALVFAITGTAQVVGFFVAGLWREERVLGSLLVFGVILVVVPLGLRLGGVLPASKFERSVNVVLAAACISLLVRAFS